MVRLSRVCADRREPEEAAGTDQEHDDAGVGQARDSQRDARASEVDTTVEDMRPGTSTMQGQKTASVVASDSWKRLASSSHETRDKRGEKRLDQWIIAEAGQPARTSALMAALAAISSRLVASSVPKMTPSEAAPMAANKVKRGVEAGGSRPSRLKRGLRSLGRQVPWQNVIDHRRDGQYPAMSTPSGLAGTICETARHRVRW